MSVKCKASRTFADLSTVSCYYEASQGELLYFSISVLYGIMKQYHIVLLL